MRCRVLVATAVAGVFLLATALPAAAQNGSSEEEQSRRVSVTGGLAVAEGETVDGPVVSVDGNARIDGRVNGAVYVGRGDLSVVGRVTGDVLVLDGDTVISGRVDGDVTVLNGKATVREGADVFGDVASRTTPTAARGTVRGQVERLDVDSLFAGFVVVLLALLWIAVTLSTAILGLFFVWLFPRATDAVVLAGRRIWASFFLGLSVGIIGPIAAVVMLASVVGIPLALAVFGTLAVLGPLGYVASSIIIGRLVVKGSGTGGRIGAFFLGFGILRFGALIPGLGFLVGFVFATYGLGALTIAGWRAGRRALGEPGATEEMVAQLGGPAPQPEVATAGTSSARPGTPGTGFTIKQTRQTRRPPAKKAKAPAKKRRTRAKTSSAKRSTSSRSRRTTARKSGPRKTTAKKRTTRTKATGAKRSTNTRSRTKKAPARKAGSRKATAKKRPTRTKRTATKRSSTTKARAARANSGTSKKKSTARKPSRSRSRTRR